MSPTVYIGLPGEGRPLPWKLALRGEIAFVESRALADETVHLVEDSGRPVSARKAVGLKRGILLRDRREQVRQQRQERLATQGLRQRLLGRLG